MRDAPRTRNALRIALICKWCEQAIIDLPRLVSSSNGCEPVEELIVPDGNERDPDRMNMPRNQYWHRDASVERLNAMTNGSEEWPRVISTVACCHNVKELLSAVII